MTRRHPCLAVLPLRRLPLLAMAGMTLPAPLSAQCNQLISISSAGAQADNDSASSGGLDATPDGAFVAFSSLAQSLVAGSSPHEDIFMRDVAAGTTVLIAGSQLADGPSGSEGTRPVSISGDGRFIAFASVASNIAPGVVDANQGNDIYVVDRLLGTTTAASAHPIAGGMQTANFASYDPDVSRNGAFIVFSSAASDLPASPPYGGVKVYRYEVATGAMIWASVPGLVNPWSPDYGTSYEPSVSGDGMAIAFTGTARLTVDDRNPGLDIFVRDYSGPYPTTKLVSVQPPESIGSQGVCMLPSISDNGRRIAFISNIPRLTTDPVPAGMSMIYLRDLDTQQTVLISKPTAGVPASAHCDKPYISANGRYVVFSSSAANLPGWNGLNHVYVHDTFQGTTSLATMNSSAEPANGTSIWGVALDTASTVFESQGSNLVPGDANGEGDVFLRDLASDCP